MVYLSVPIILTIFLSLILHCSLAFHLRIMWDDAGSLLEALEKWRNIVQKAGFGTTLEAWDASGAVAAAAGVRAGATGLPQAAGGDPGDNSRDTSRGTPGDASGDTSGGSAGSGALSFSRYLALATTMDGEARWSPQADMQLVELISKRASRCEPEFRKLKRIKARCSDLSLLPSGYISDPRIIHVSFIIAREGAVLLTY